MNMISKELSLDSVDSECGKTEDSHDSNPNKQQNVSSKKKEREGKNKSTPGNQTSDDSHDDEDSNDEDILTTRRYTHTISSTNQQHTPNPVIHKAKTRGGRWFHWNGIKISTLHPNQAF